VRAAADPDARQLETLTDSSLYMVHSQDAEKAYAEPLGYTRVRMLDGTVGYVRNFMVGVSDCAKR
jgi:hypothetical protein